MVAIRSRARVRFAALLLTLCTSVPASAATATLVRLGSIDAGETVISHFRYEARDCKDAFECSFLRQPVPGVLKTASRTSHFQAQPAEQHVAAMLTGFKLWSSKQVDPGKVKVSVDVQRGGMPGQVKLTQLLALYEVDTSAGYSFSYDISFVVVESTVEGVHFLRTSQACRPPCPSLQMSTARLPVDLTVLGFGLRSFDSDRPIAPLFGAAAFPSKIKVTQGQMVESVISCGTVRRPPADELSGPCESHWVIMAARIQSTPPPRLGPGSSATLTPWVIQTPPVNHMPLNVPAPLTTPIDFQCRTQPQKLRGMLFAMHGFRLLAGISTSNAQSVVGFTPFAQKNVNTELHVELRPSTWSSASTPLKSVAGIITTSNSPVTAEVGATIVCLY